ncbi:glycerophosphodiester phosphodiesterase [Nannocystis radixulma]|uniref:Glycerophosphodiester phosphodiesterase family protein n=1 Tax=Nannocystis radixulma TaxID=2995305 RepID=A0ABT5AWZ7_9BACT|nr:glycerophosphodiester phosphodiesterase family protein [Nannocystis radixulma]MDC0666361.1 glycerophosphodiester phosphodiesterase family protein [Nannocystis radixulma]
MKIIARGGNALHAPDSSTSALLGAYVSGADALGVAVQRTRDDRLVVLSERDVSSSAGKPGRVDEMTLAELNELDFSAGFRPRGAARFHYVDPAQPQRRIRPLLFAELLELLPEDVALFVELAPPPAGADAYARQVVEALDARALGARTVVSAADPELLRVLAGLAPRVNLVFDGRGARAEDCLALVARGAVDGVFTDIAAVVTDGRLTAFGAEIERVARRLGCAIGAVLRPVATADVLGRAQYDELRRLSFVWGATTASMLETAVFTRQSATLIEESFAGDALDRRRFALGYAKANSYCRVYPGDGIHVEIAAYDGAAPPIADSPLERRLQEIEARLMDASRDWPFYSGGGVGVRVGLRGDFVAEVDYTTESVCQATTLEMAVVNVDPGPHRGEPPRSFRDKDSFYDPHGAPPFCGVEHDEDDGFRINWNLGSEYDSNQYGGPVGDGKTPRGGRLRLERRGACFAAYYRNDDATDWVCCGTARNESLNPTVFLRCVGKRWRQEDENDPSKWVPIVANHFVFRNLKVMGFGGGEP